MATKKISELPLITALSGSQQETLIPVVVGGLNGTTNRITAENFSKFVNAYNATTSSNTFIGAQIINGNLTVTGNQVISGRLTVNEVVAQYETASILFSTGSTKLGDQLTDKHEFTGSTNITGSIIVDGNLLLNGASLNNSFTRIHQATGSLQSFTSSQADRNLDLSIVTGSLNQFTASQDDRNFVISQFTASQLIVNTGLASVTASLNNFSGSTNAFTGGIERTTASIHLATASLNYFYQSTSSLNGFTSSQADRNLNLSIVTGSVNRFTASQDDRNYIISQYTASTDAHIVGISAFTSSQLAVNLGNSIYTASVDSHIVGISTYTSSVRDTLARVHQSTASLQQFTASQDTRNLTLSTVTGSLIGITNGLMAFTAALDNTYATDAQLYQLYQATRSLELHSGSMVGVTNGLMAYTASNTSLNTGLRGEVDGIEAYTASLKAAAIVSSSTQIQNYDIFALNSNLYNGTGSIKAEIGGIEAYTASLKAAAIVSSSTQIFTGYDYEIHVSQVDGNDTTGNGDLLTPVATITKALQIVTANFGVTDRRTIILHPGTYTENPTISIANTYIFALGLLGANTAIAGTLTINAACRVSGIKMTNLIVNTTAAVYINNTTVDTQMTVTNTGYLETTGCSFQCPSGVTISGAAPAVVFNSTTLWGLVVNNASAVVIVRNSPQVYVATVTAGNLALSNTLLFSSTPTGNAITTSASSVVTLSNLNILDNTGLAVARVSLSGFYSIIDVVYDKPNSTLVSLSGTGGPLNAIDYFQYINADKFITQGGTGYQFLKGDGSLDSIMPSSLQQTTASLNTYTGSNDSVVARILQTTASLNTFTGSLRNEVNGIEAYTASLKGAAIVSSSQQITNYYKFAETASANIFYNYQAISGSKLELHTSDANGGLVINSKATATQTFITLLDRGTNDNSIVATFEDTNGSNQLGGLKIEAGRKDNQAGIILKGKNKVANSGAVNGYITSVIGNAYSDNALTTLTTGVTGKSISFLGQDTELANLNFNGDLTITNGNLVMASGKGIDFSANSNAAGMTSELLNDYEIGTFTPTIEGSSTAGTGTYTTQQGTYTKIGNLVTISVWVSWSAHTGTGNLQLAGFPFTSIGTTNYRASGTFGWVENLTLSANNIVTMAITPSSTKSDVTQYPAGGGAASSVPLDAAANLHYSITYQTA
jgi:hypothetical protein